MERSGEGLLGLVEAEGCGAHLFEAGPQVLDAMTPPVGGAVVCDGWVGPVRRHTRFGAGLFDHVTPRGGRVGTITHHPARRADGADLVKEIGGGAKFAGLSAQKREGQRQAVAITRNDRLGAVAAARTAERMAQPPPFAPAAF